MTKDNLPSVIDRTAPLAVQVDQILNHGLAVPEDDPQVIAQSIANRLLQAESIEELFAPTTTKNSTDLVGQRLQLRDAVIRKSDLENTQMYMLIDAVNLETGEAIVMNTSSPRIMAQVARASDLGALPLSVQVVEVGVAKTGQNAPTGLILA